jgi:hypothetical protein
MPFPYGLAYLYGVPIKLFGDAGFVVGDVIISIARIAVCMLLMRPFYRTPAARLAAAIVLFTMTGPVPGLSRVWTMFIHPLWDLRNIRPFITGMVALTLVYTTWLVNEDLAAPRPSRVLYVVQGALIGLVMQGDLHTGIIASLVTAGVGFILFCTRPTSDLADLAPHLRCRLGLRCRCGAYGVPGLASPPRRCPPTWPGSPPTHRSAAYSC